MRILYSVLFYLALPMVVGRLYWRSIKVPAYRFRIGERFGFYSQESTKKPVVWVHAVSVGEAEAVFPLINELKQEYPELSILMTTTTPTGSARVKASLGNSVLHCYLPYDVPGAVNRFLAHFAPLLAVMVETEIWPNLYAACAQRELPLYIVNARLSEKSFKGYQKLSSFIRNTLNHVSLIAAQTDEDAQRFQLLGIQNQRLKVVGNIKFDLPAMDEVILGGKAIRLRLFQGRFVWILASTHKGEELIFINIYQQLKEIAPELVFIIAPRHPERFLEVKLLFQQAGLDVLMRTELVGIEAQESSPVKDIFILDSIGELKTFYAAADLAFVGGSLVSVGGHNVLEPAALCVPILFGPYMHNFKMIAEGLIALSGAIQCTNEQELISAFTQLYQSHDQSQSLINSATEFVRRNQGAMQGVLDLLAPAIAQIYNSR